MKKFKKFALIFLILAGAGYYWKHVYYFIDDLLLPYTFNIKVACGDQPIDFPGVECSGSPDLMVYSVVDRCGRIIQLAQGISDGDNVFLNFSNKKIVRCGFWRSTATHKDCDVPGWTCEKPYIH